jgi:cell division protein FtsB
MTGPQRQLRRYPQDAPTLVRVLQLILDSSRAALSGTSGDTELGVDIDAFLGERISSYSKQDLIEPAAARHFLVELRLLSQLPGGNWRFKPSLLVREDKLAELYEADNLPYIEPAGDDEDELTRLRAENAKLRAENKRLSDAVDLAARTALDVAKLLGTARDPQ